MLLPNKLISSIAKWYPKAWRLADEFRADRGKDLPEWPDWCFLPLAEWYTIVCEELKVDALAMEQIHDIQRLAALGAWRPSQGIYEFTPELFSAVASTPLDGNIPCDMLFRMPEWCIYIKLNNPDFCSDPRFMGEMDGAFVHLEHDANTREPELRIMLASETGLGEPLIVHLGDWTLEEAWQRTLDVIDQNARRFGIGTVETVFESIDDPLSKKRSGMLGSEYLGKCMELSRVILNLTLYLCSEEPDIRDGYGSKLSTNLHPTPVSTKKGWRIFPPDQPRIWHVGDEVSRLMHQTERGSLSSTGKKSPRPHIRRAHWHGFWEGSKKAPRQRRFTLKWLPPIAVALKKDLNKAQTL